MPKLRWRGSEPAYVSPLDRTVEPDEVVDVPAALMAKPIKDSDTGDVIGHEGYEWPEELWAVVSTKAKSSKDEE